MASGCGAGSYSGRPAWVLELCISTYAVDTPNNRSSYYWELRQKGPTGTWVLDAVPWNVNINGQGFSGSANGDFRTSGNRLIGSGYTGWIDHDAAGNAGVNGAASHGNLLNGFGTAYTSVNFWADRIARPPAALAFLGVFNVTTTNMAVSFQVGDNRGAAIDFMVVNWYADAARTVLVWQNIQGGGNPGDYRYSQASDGGVTLAPGSTYYFTLNAHNAAGWGTESFGSGSTLPATPPGITVAPSLSGLSAVATMTPPSGSSGVAFYAVQYRPLGATGDGVQQAGANPITVEGLTPGTIYEWRALAAYAIPGGATFSPWSAWVPYQQPNPNTNPGDYFDGSSADTADTDFVWSGTANNSISLANGLHPTGWADFAQAAAISGGAGAAYRVTGAIGLYPGGQPTGSFSARYAFRGDASAAGFRAGTDDALTAEVSEGGTYYGSIYARPSKSQRLAALIVWYDDLGVEIGTTLGPAQVVAAGSTVRLLAGGLAPEDGQAAVFAVDVTGTGWSLWLGGDSITVDAAMLTIGSQYAYFDGSAPDTAQYLYAWLGAANASVSTRTTLSMSEGDPLEDPDCPSPPSPPTPPQIVDDCVTEVGTWRRYWVQVPAGEIAEWIATIPTLILTTGAQAAREVRIRVFSNPDALAPSVFIPGEWVSEQIVRYMPPLTTLRIDGVSERVRASVNGGAWIAADHLLYGTGGAPATWPVLQCGDGYLIALDVPLDASLGNLAADLELTRRML